MTSTVQSVCVWPETPCNMEREAVGRSSVENVLPIPSTRERTNSVQIAVEQSRHLRMKEVSNLLASRSKEGSEASY